MILCKKATYKFADNLGRALVDDTT